MILYGEDIGVGPSVLLNVSFGEREYEVRDDKFAPVLSRLCRCDIRRIRGTYSYERHSSETGGGPTLLAFSGPLGVLGGGRIGADGKILSFLDGRLVLAFTNDSPITLWDIAIDELKSRGASITFDAANLLWEAVSDEFGPVSVGAANAGTQSDMSSVTRQIIRETVQLAEASGDRRINAVSLRGSIERRCPVPVYPFCRRKLR